MTTNDVLTSLFHKKKQNKSLERREDIVKLFIKLWKATAFHTWLPGTWLPPPSSPIHSKGHSGYIIRAQATEPGSPGWSLTMASELTDLSDGQFSSRLTKLPVQAMEANETMAARRLQRSWGIMKNVKDHSGTRQTRSCFEQTCTHLIKVRKTEIGSYFNMPTVPKQCKSGYLIIPFASWYVIEQPKPDCFIPKSHSDILRIKRPQAIWSIIILTMESSDDNECQLYPDVKTHEQISLGRKRIHSTSAATETLQWLQSPLYKLDFWTLEAHTQKSCFVLFWSVTFSLIKESDH